MRGSFLYKIADLNGTCVSYNDVKDATRRSLCYGLIIPALRHSDAPRLRSSVRSREYTLDFLEELPFVPLVVVLFLRDVHFSHVFCEYRDSNCLRIVSISCRVHLLLMVNY